MKSRSYRKNLLSPPAPNYGAHEEDHRDRPKVLYYTAQAAEGDAAHAKALLYPLRGRRVVRMRMTCRTAPVTTDLEGDIFINNGHLTSTLDSDPRIRAGETMGEVIYYMGGRTIPYDADVFCQVTSASDAGFPVVFEIEFI